MASNGYYGNWPQNYAHGGFQRNIHQPASSESWNRTSSSTPSNFPALSAGYVHSGYQAAIQGGSLHSTQAFRPDFRPSYSPLMQNGMIYGQNLFSRPPRLGPGGPIRCSYPGCEYSGYAKGVEVHKMDRHLIFPPGYKPPKSAPDADVGPDVTIPGTGISLNTPDAIEAWIAERKKNWPTAARVAEKQKRKVEAIERGEIDRPSNKRPRIDGPASFDGHYGQPRGRARGRGTRGGYRGRGRGAGVVASMTQGSGEPVIRHTFEFPAKPRGYVVPDDAGSETHRCSDTDSGSDIDPLQDVISSKMPPREHEESDDETRTEQLPAPTTDVAIKAHKKRQPKQPAPKAYNPLVDRPSFLRKLLQPEIRHTVSNLSQAVRFIVDNDMFKGVELKPGDAENVLIKEMEPPESNTNRTGSSNGFS